MQNTISDSSLTPRQRQQALVLLAVVNFTGSVAANGSRVAIPLSAVKLGATPFQIGLILACYAGISALIAIYIGRWVDRTGPQVTLRAAALAQAAGVLLSFAVQSLWALALTGAAVGICNAIFQISLQHTAGGLAEGPARTRIFTWMTLSQSLALLAAPPLTGLVIDHAGHRQAFLAMGVVSIALLGLLLAADRVLPAARQAGARVRRRLGDLMQYPKVRAALVVCSLTPLSWELLFFFVPLHGTQIGLSASAIGLVFTTLSIAIFAVRLAVPMLSKRLSEWTMIAIALGTAGGMFLIFPLTHSAASLMLLAAVLGAGMGISQPITLSLVYTVSPSGRQAEVLGIRTTTINSVQTVAPLLLGALTASLGLGTALWPFALVLLAGARYARSRNALSVAGA